ncbi:unnamed protein product [Rhizoctonia solani]|uniref:Uncharacterized protein n=1 Tax=Rhizoctonia solani TaxID=456999 RepID=A0A8H3GE09_9AGAM|nr:unnamed protein product [Rhizoctonia solani]
MPGIGAPDHPANEVPLRYTVNKDTQPPDEPELSFPYRIPDAKDIDHCGHDDSQGVAVGSLRYEPGVGFGASAESKKLLQPAFKIVLGTMSQHLALSHHTRASFSMSGGEDKIFLKAPSVHRNFIGKRNVESPWMVSDSKTIEGTLSYEDIKYISGAAQACAEIVVRKLVVEFKSLKSEEDNEVVVAIFKSDDDVEAMVTTVSDGNWQSF